MKRIRQLSLLLAMTLLFTSSELFAQLKVGTNPTTIGANSNLEVEASTTGRKVIVDKTTGQLTVADGTQAAGKVLTSDANGATSWQTSTAVANVTTLRVEVQGFGQGVSGDSYLFVIATDWNDIPNAGVGNNFIRLPAGTYRLTGTLTGSFTAAHPSNYQQLDLYIGQQFFGGVAGIASPTTNFYVMNGGAIFKVSGTADIQLNCHTQMASGVGVNVLGGSGRSVMTIEKLQ